MPAAPARRRRGPIAWLAGLDDGAIIRAAFFGMLAATLAVLYVDFEELTGADLAEAVLPDIPILPAFTPADAGGTPAPAVTSDPALLRAPLAVSLETGGVLRLTGTITPGSADRVAAEIAARGEYVETVALDSPGGSVDEALRIAALLKAEGYTTSVAAGALCASSCPLVFAAGQSRLASRAAAIGVHQVYTVAEAGSAPPTGARAVGTAMAEAQRTTATITRYLETTGADPALWLHALETPPDRLYYFSPDELTNLRLATELSD